MFQHLAFDLLACFAALLIGLWQKTKLRLPDNPHIKSTYILFLMLGSVSGGYLFGTWNLILSHKFILAHSVLGALVGAILFIEIYKICRKINTPTGGAYALPFCVAVAVGRIGCYLAGLDDMTYGTATNLPWAVDFGDGIPRHPVQLYETITMALAAVVCGLWLKADVPCYLKYAFPSVVGFYALQRFLWEFLKPYGTMIGPLNLFHVLCLFLMAYSLTLIYRRSRFV